MNTTSTPPTRGLFIVLEGIDGSGKTTMAKKLIENLSAMGYRASYTYEPTDSDIVTVVKTRYKAYRDPYIDALTFALDRLIHVKSKIKPLLDNGYVVISDRYFYSSVAYQTACGAPMEWVIEVNKWALRPDLAIYLDIDPDLALKRKGTSSSRFPEFENIELMRRVRTIYLELVKRGLLVMIDASRSIDAVYHDIEKLVLSKLTSKTTTSSSS
ncbi:MAG: dTMP kinase [Desulfurococcaceae archaeon]